MKIIVWCLVKYVVLFGMKSENVFAIVGSNCLKVEILFYFFRQTFFTFFFTIRMDLIKKQFCLYLTYGQTILKRIYQQIKMYKPSVSWLVLRNAYH